MSCNLICDVVTSEHSNAPKCSLHSPFSLFTPRIPHHAATHSLEKRLPLLGNSGSSFHMIKWWCLQSNKLPCTQHLLHSRILKLPHRPSHPHPSTQTHISSNPSNPRWLPPSGPPSATSACSSSWSTKSKSMATLWLQPGRPSTVSWYRALPWGRLGD